MAETPSNQPTESLPRPAPAVPDHVMIRRIGEGGYGEVWLARSVTGSYRAVKVLYREKFDNSGPFEREFTGIRNFEPISRSHDGFMHVLHVGRNDAAGFFYYVMELADDASAAQINPDSYKPKTLKSVLESRGKLPVRECVQIGLALAEALERLHQHGFIHRDIKPANIIFVDGKLKLADVGLVAEAQKGSSYVGTMGFLPPESPSGPACDIYGLGKLLYVLSTGKHPAEFPALPTNLETMTDKELFLQLNRLIVKACQHDPQRRHRNATELRGELAALLVAGVLPPKPRRPISTEVWIMTAAIALLLTGVCLWLTEKPPDQTATPAEPPAARQEIKVPVLVESPSTEPTEPSARLKKTIQIAQAPPPATGVTDRGMRVVEKPAPPAAVEPGVKSTPAAVTAPPAARPTDSNAYRELAEQLAGDLKEVPVSVGVGNFVYQDTTFMSPFSSLVREELERVLAQTGKFKVVTRDRLADLQKEGKFLDSSVMEPDASTAKVKFDGIQGIVRGRFYYNPPDLTVFAELAWLEGGTVRKAKVVLPAQTAGAPILPPGVATAKPADELFVPQNIEQSRVNLKDVEQKTGALWNRQDFLLQLSVREGKRCFADGETISYRVFSDTDCHVAVLNHQVDGSTVVLFPNRFCRDTHVSGGASVDIPGAVKSGFEIVIGKPYGTEMVQVIACTQASALHRKLRDHDYAAETAANTGYRSLTRGMFVQGVAESLAAPADPAATAPRWAETHIMVSSYPKLKQ
ncbi:MAG: DUF4384 domain-containing protein [Verrucomicrobia bacterium]|nr:DUF4384 domain-containing protein [Verrucomicrobiota bacterium]